MIGDDAAGVDAGARRDAVAAQRGLAEVDGDEVNAVPLHGGEEAFDLLRLVDGGGAVEDYAVGWPALAAFAVV